MNTIYQGVFAEENIFLCEALPFSLCRVTSPSKLARLSFVPKTAIVFLLPYYVADTGAHNLSRYAWAKDYHLFVKALSAGILPKLQAMYPDNSFAIFADNSPIDERHAAALCGLGVLGDNGLLLTKRYGPYVFIGEILCDLSPDTVGVRENYEIAYCEHCGACRAACPKKELCLSALTQKKGVLSEDEKGELLALGSVWGCDICQDVCPHARGAEETPIAFFKADLIPYLTSERLSQMTLEEFEARAYAWRGRNTIERNLKFWEEKPC